jgi:hypothetical protein
LGHTAYQFLLVDRHLYTNSLFKITNNAD